MVYNKFVYRRKLLTLFQLDKTVECNPENTDLCLKIYKKQIERILLKFIECLSYSILNLFRKG